VSKLDLILTPHVSKKRHAGHGPTVIVGGGTKQSGAIAGMVTRAVEKAKAGKVRIKKTKPSGVHPPAGIDGPSWGLDSSGLYLARPRGRPSGRPRKRARAVSASSNSPEYNAIINGAEGLASAMRQARFFGIDRMVWDRIQRAADWAAGDMTAFGDAFIDNKATVDHARREFNIGLPIVSEQIVAAYMQEMKAQGHVDVPEPPPEDVAEAAANALLEQIQELYQILGLTAAVIEPYRFEENLPKLHALNNVMLNYFHVSQGIDPEKWCRGEETQPILPLSFWHTEDRIVSAILGNGLGVLPGGTIGNGALGAHVLLFQTDMELWLAQALALCGHEKEHLINSAKGFQKERAKITFTRIHDGIENGTIKVRDKEILWAGQKVPTAMAYASLATQLIEEDSCDGGAVRLLGNFFKMMTSSFVAFGHPKGGIAQSSRPKLRSNSVFGLRRTPQGVKVIVEEHVPDIARVLYDTMHLRVLARPPGLGRTIREIADEADRQESQCRELIGNADTVRFNPINDKWDVPPIDVPLSDLEAIGQEMAMISAHQKFKSLRGHSMAEVCNWFDARDGRDPMRRNRKGAAAAASLSALISTPPKVDGTFLPLHVVHGATEAYWEAAMRGEAEEFGPKLQPVALEMIAKAQEQVECGCP
jgi:hypothetical protein